MALWVPERARLGRADAINGEIFGRPAAQSTSNNENYGRLNMQNLLSPHISYGSVLRNRADEARRIERLENQRRQELWKGGQILVNFLCWEAVKCKEKTVKIVPAHRAILSSASDVFEAMFRYDEGQIEIPDTEIEAFKTMLTFIYTKHFNGLDANNLLEVLKAADKYNITGLVKECANFCANVSIQKLPNVFVSFQEARFLNVEALRWTDEQCRQNGIECSAENRREILGPALFNIRFPLIPKEDFTKGIVPTGVLTIEEVISIYQHYSHPNLSDVPGFIPLKFPTQQRYKSEGTIEMEIDKVSEFVVEEVGSERLSDAVDIGGFSWKILAEIKTKKELLDLSKGFYNKDEDKVKLAIDVVVDKPKTEKIISDPNKSNGTLLMEIEKLSEFAREFILSQRKSETLYIKGMPWEIEAQIRTKNESTEKWLGFYLSCDSSEKDGNWSRKCMETFRIVSQKSGVSDFKKEFNGTVFNKYSTSWGWNNFISFAELMDPSKGLYNKDEDKVTLAIDFTCE
ncbi:hypothetical protein niasHT_018744 [Heterodera trifolii]|uniref:BTB domain-containing protein n=1 Tax=Heterodera trifolii TaxID=157864 RepID=A0ABD2LBC5_9BILA